MEARTGKLRACAALVRKCVGTRPFLCLHSGFMSTTCIFYHRLETGTHDVRYSHDSLTWTCLKGRTKTMVDDTFGQISGRLVECHAKLKIQEARCTWVL